jgi:serine/threonine protein kinase
LAIPGYELLEKVAEGGMGTVYRARQLSLQLFVAVKVLRKQAGGSPQAFQSETRLLASLSHPNVLAIHDCGQIGDLYYLVTEFLSGSSLRVSMPPGQPWPIPKAYALLDKVAGALSYIHRNGILHLDLKPENVLCTPEGQVKIADFGLALPHAQANVLAQEDQIQGTADYCSLEQRHGLPTDERSDLYSLAVLSYELLTGHLPGRAYEKASTVNAKLPQTVDDVLRRALARRQEQRQGSVEEFRRELAAALQPKKRFSGMAVLTAALLVILIGAIFLARQWTGPSEPSGPAPLAWLLGDEPESLTAFRSLAEARSEPIVTVHAGTQHAKYKQPPLPLWPTPRPVLFLKSAEGSGFFHPLFGVEAGKTFLVSWPGPVQWPAFPPEDNFVRVGNFSGKQVWRKDGGPWMIPPDQKWKPGDGIQVAPSPDRPDNPALLLDKSNSNLAERLMCYQWVSRLPDAGTVMVLRYRAKTESGGGRLCVGPTMPLYVPDDDRSAIAQALRKRSKPHAYLPAKKGSDVRDYRLEDWVRPTSDWQTYCLVWEWPPFCVEAGGRNVVVEYRGLGKVWLDDVELFPWDNGSKK